MDTNTHRGDYAPTLAELDRAEARRARTFATITDVIDQYVTPSLGDFADDFDIDGIADDITCMRSGQIVLRDDIDFWAIAAEHETAA